jgi:hypothetical protein
MSTPEHEGGQSAFTNEGFSADRETRIILIRDMYQCYGHYSAGVSAELYDPSKSMHALSAVILEKLEHNTGELSAVEVAAKNVALCVERLMEEESSSDFIHQMNQKIAILGQELEKSDGA